MKFARESSGGPEKKISRIPHGDKDTYATSFYIEALISILASGVANKDATGDGGVSFSGRYGRNQGMHKQPNVRSLV